MTSSITSYAQLEEFGRTRLSPNFFMREFPQSEIATWHGMRNVPENPERAVWAGQQLCNHLLEPLQATFGRIHVRSVPLARSQCFWQPTQAQLRKQREKLRQPHLGLPHGRGALWRHGLHRDALAGGLC
jgi:hypothetical protein